jgi:hypothetical protein
LRGVMLGVRIGPRGPTHPPGIGSEPKRPQESQHELVELGALQKVGMSKSGEDVGFHSRGGSDHLGLSNRYTLIQLPMKDQEGDLQFSCPFS